MWCINYVVWFDVLVERVRTKSMENVIQGHLVKIKHNCKRKNKANKNMINKLRDIMMYVNVHV